MTRGGRPEVPPQERRSERVVAYLTPGELGALKAHAEGFQVSVSELARRAITRVKLAAPVSAENLSQWHDIGRLALNLNTFVRQSHILSKRLDEHDDQGPVVREELLALISSVNGNVLSLIDIMHDVRALLTDTWEASQRDATLGREEESQG